MLFSHPLLLQCGASITVQAWSYLHYGAHYADLRHLLATIREDATTHAANPLGQQLMDRVVEASVPRPEDRALIAVPDLDALLELIYRLNNLEELAKKAFSLHAQLVQAMLQGEAEGQLPFPTEAPTPTSLS